MPSRAGLDAPLVEVLTETIRAFDDGRSVHEVMCRGIAALLHATVAAFVRLESSTSRCTVECWPTLAEPATLRYVTSETWPPVERGAHKPTIWQWRHTAAFEIMRDLLGALDYTEVQLAQSELEGRLAVFAKPLRFTFEEVRLLAVCAVPLAVIDGHALKLAERSRSEVPTQASSQDRPGLTRREIEVLALLQQGLKARAMAARLGVSQRTVNKHLGNVYQKLDAHDRLVAVTKAQAFGILPRA